MRLLAGLVVIGLSSLAAAVELQYSPRDSRQFQFFKEQQHMFVEPGNVGSLIFRRKPPVESGHLQGWQDHGCNVRLLRLVDITYDYRIDEAQPEDGLVGYWAQLDSYIANATLNGMATFAVLDDAFVDMWREKPQVVDQLITKVRAQGAEGYNAPTFVFRTSQWGVDEKALRDKLSLELPGSLIGMYYEGDRPGMVKRGWGFVVVDETCVPWNCRGQVMSDWLLHEFGQVPRMVACQKPDFLQQSLWLASSVSGVWFPPLASSGEDNEEQARELRATSVFFTRFSLPVRLVPRLPGRGVVFGLRGENDIAWAMQFPNPEIALPSDFTKRTVRGGWYNPATDENILEPVTRSGDVLNLQLPGQALWVYTLSKSRARIDTGTTVSAIREWQD